MDKKAFFSQEGVTVSQTRFVVLDKVYEIKRISTLTCKKSSPDFSLAILHLFIGVLLILNEDDLFALGGCFVLLGIIFSVAARPRYSIILSLPEGEVTALTSTDQQHVDRIIQAIHVYSAESSPVEIHDECVADSDPDLPSFTPPAIS